MKRLTCSCCGSTALGKQWFNQDTGYGLCGSCVPYVMGKSYGGSWQELSRSHGKPGENFAIPLTLGAEVGQLVYSKSVNGDYCCGVLKEWDNGTAIVKVHDSNDWDNVDQIKSFSINQETQS